jgi:hypothetical protein
VNQLNVSLQHSIATLAANNWSARKIARELGIDRETVRRYLRMPQPDSKPAIVPSGSPEVPDPKPAIPPAGSSEDADSKPAIPPAGSEPVAGSKPAIVPAGSKAGRTSQCAPLAAVIEQGLLAGLSAQRLYQDLVAQHGFSGGYRNKHPPVHDSSNPPSRCSANCENPAANQYQA